ncbi:MAG TPA: hypothetical protein VKY89_17115 [Thermoanaerobaculia bacterium]|jgi:hypothetical protein|nr:hypothetical protein [Thermoanaerobaculia bacterium]
MRALRGRAWMLVALFAGTGALALCQPCAAVPMWARRYNVGCNTCHNWPALQLTATGLDFLRRGHRFKGDGFDKDWTHLVAAHVEWEYDAASGTSNQFNSPEFHLHAGGAFTENFSGYVNANINNELEAAYLQYTKEWGDDAYFTARGGRLSPTLLRNYGNGLEAGASDPLILSSTTLNANPFTPDRNDNGVDVGGRYQMFFLQAGVLDGDDVAGQASVGKHKDFYGSLEATPDGVSGVGLYYHHGGYDLGDPAMPPQLDDSYQREGVFANYSQSRFRVAGAYLFGKDQVATVIPDRKIRGYYLQVNGYPTGWVALFARYDDTTTQDETGQQRTRQGTVGATFEVFEKATTSARIALEAGRQELPGMHTNLGVVNLLWAF